MIDFYCFKHNDVDVFILLHGLIVIIPSRIFGIFGDFALLGGGDSVVGVRT